MPPMFLFHPDIFKWDLAILILLSLSLCGMVTCFVWIRRQHERRLQKLFVGIIGLFALICFGMLIYGSFIEPRIVVNTEYTVPFPTKERLKIVVLGDFHTGPYKGKWIVEEAVRRANLELPDLVLITGDFILGEETDLEMLSSLANLRTSLGTYAVLGNHDIGRLRASVGKYRIMKNRGDEIESFLEKIGIPVLRNEHMIISLPDESIAIAGVEDLWTEEDDLAGALEGIEEGTSTILISHNPGIILDKNITSIDLLVSGHTHGGQIRLPFFGSLAPMPTDLGPKYDQGIFPIPSLEVLVDSTRHVISSSMIITRGLGESSARARLFAWPEVVVLTTIP